jgi:hypothetical protein
MPAAMTTHGTFVERGAGRYSVAAQARPAERKERSSRVGIPVVSVDVEGRESLSKMWLLIALPGRLNS